MRGGEPELELSTGRVRERVGRRESDLNVVGPKTVDIGQTGQTGCRDRSDRLPRPVRPVQPRLTGDVLVLCFAV